MQAAFASSKLSIKFVAKFDFIKLPKMELVLLLCKYKKLRAVQCDILIMIIEWNPDCSNPQFLEPLENSNQMSFLLLSRTL